VSAANGALLTVTDVHARYGAIEALKGVSLEVGEGEVVTLIGSNGAGKSTTLRAITGLTPASAGTVNFAGEDITRVPAQEIVPRGEAPERLGVDDEGQPWSKPSSLAAFATALEAQGVDAIAFTDHPAPSKKWLEGGGHATIDPFAITTMRTLLTALAGEFGGAYQGWTTEVQV